MDAERISFVAIVREISTESVEGFASMNEIGPFFFDRKMSRVGDTVRVGDRPVVIGWIDGELMLVIF